MVYRLALFFSLLMGGFTPPLRGESEQSTPQQQIAEEAYIYLYPLVLMDLTRQQMTNVAEGEQEGKGPMNTLVHFKSFPDASFRDVVRPNFDTLYSIAWMDLSDGPLLLSVPDTEGRYYMMQLLDMWTDAFAVPGKRTTGTDEETFALVGPGWEGELPEEVTRIEAPTPTVWLIGRTQTNGEKDYAAVHKVQEGYQLKALNPTSPEGKPIDFSVDMKTPPLVQMEEMSPQEFFTRGLRLMAEHPPHASDGSVVLRMSQIGLNPDEEWEFTELDPQTQEALNTGAKAAAGKMKALAPKVADVKNGWQMNTDTMGVYGNAYLKRAVIAQVGLGANPQVEAVYPLSVSDANGDPLKGGKAYRLHFDKRELPPAKAFWSVTLYDDQGFPVENDLKRHALGDRDPLKYNEDGSLDLYIQPENPGEEKATNWLPSPEKGEFSLTMRLYAPEEAVLTGAWVPPPIQP